MDDVATVTMLNRFGNALQLHGVVMIADGRFLRPPLCVVRIIVSACPISSIALVYAGRGGRRTFCKTPRSRSARRPSSPRASCTLPPLASPPRTATYGLASTTSTRPRAAVSPPGPDWTCVSGHRRGCRTGERTGRWARRSGVGSWSCRVGGGRCESAQYHNLASAEGARWTDGRGRCRARQRCGSHRGSSRLG